MRTVDLPEDLREELEIPLDAELLTCSWGYRNGSFEAPELGYYRDNPRKKFFGNLFEVTAQPPESTFDGYDMYNWDHWIGDEIVERVAQQKLSDRLETGLVMLLLASLLQ